jgi:hypothetical protein
VPAPDQAVQAAAEGVGQQRDDRQLARGPVLVTVPIGAWVASFVFDLGSRLSDEPVVFAKGAYRLIGVGVVGAVAAAMLGFLDLFAIPTGTRAFRTGLLHMALTSRWWSSSPARCCHDGAGSSGRTACPRA